MSQLLSWRTPPSKGRLKFYERLLKPTAATAVLLACLSSNSEAQRRINPVPPVGWTEHPEVVYPSAYRRTVQAVPTVQRIYMWPQYWPGIPYQTQAEHPHYGDGFPIIVEEPGIETSSQVPTRAVPGKSPQPMSTEQTLPAQSKSGASLTIPPVPGHLPVSYPTSQPRELPSQYLTPKHGPSETLAPRLAPVVRSTSAEFPHGRSVLDNRPNVASPTLPISTSGSSSIPSIPIGYRAQQCEPGCGDPIGQ